MKKLGEKMAAIPTAHVEIHYIILALFLIVGVVGNLLALFRLARNSSNSNFTILLKFLMTNNMIGLGGVLIMFILKLSFPKYLIDDYFHWFCAFWVIFRFFGICSGCIAVLMSIERYLAICHIFFHFTHFTRNLNVKAIIGLSFLGALITFLPFFGFGTYLDEDTKKCIHYREGKTLSDRTYAILVLCFGTLICVIIVTLNTFVVMALHKKRMQNGCSSSSNIVNLTTLPLQENEIKCSRLMVLLDLSFVICWMPDMVAIIFLLKNSLSKEHWFYRLADDLMALHFILDPYIYMLNKKPLQLCWNFMQWGTSRMRRTRHRLRQVIQT